MKALRGLAPQVLYSIRVNLILQHAADAGAVQATDQQQCNRQGNKGRGGGHEVLGSGAGMLERTLSIDPPGIFISFTNDC
ncbi:MULTISPECIES: hypothetical protein [unclassified Pseudomonas]|uniref:hypothetical protein n=1 Tax=unclassified Pseudomonas TaxID=196821 RepID=UPI000B896B6F|nr:MULTISPECIES: hypothetical protein [unclassified Pseudomonas]